MGSNLAKQADAIGDLRETLKPGDKLWAVYRGEPTRTGTQFLDLFLFRCRDGEPEVRRLTYTAAMALGWRYSDRREALTVDEVGTLAEHAAVHALGVRLFGDGRALRVERLGV